MMSRNTQAGPARVWRYDGTLTPDARLLNALGITAEPFTYITATAALERERGVAARFAAEPRGRGNRQWRRHDSDSSARWQCPSCQFPLLAIRW